MGEGLHHPDQLPRLSQSFDVTIIDCPPRHDKIHRAALAIADVVILPCSPSVADVWALAESVELVERARIFRPDLLAYILVNRSIANSVVAREAREALGQFSVPTLQTELGARVDYAMAMGAGCGASQFRSGAASVELKMLTDELEKALGGEHDDAKGPALDEIQTAHPSACSA